MQNFMIVSWAWRKCRRDSDVCAEQYCRNQIAEYALRMKVRLGSQGRAQIVRY
jgi:hypothetical protein